jgi:hypothetical protein
LKTHQKENTKMKETNTPAIATAVQPHRIEIAELTHTAFAIANVLIRRGYVFDPNTPPYVFLNTGYTTIVLVLGDSDSHAVTKADAAESIALARQQAANQRNAEEAARETAEAVERAEKEATAQAEIESHRKAIARLQRSIRAA